VPFPAFEELTKDLPAGTDSVKIEYVRVRAAFREGYQAEIDRCYTPDEIVGFGALTWF
jgi:hypothetical protein